MAGAEKEKRTLFGMDSDELAEALEAIYKQQRKHAEQVEELLTHVRAMRTSVLTPEQQAAQAAAMAAAGGDDGDGIPPMVKWALAQPWGTQLMHTLTDQQMLGGLAKSLIDWLKSKAVQKVTETIAGGGA